MNTLEAIAARRSIRRFEERPVPREMIEQLLHAATLAPSGKNRQPWRFIVVEGEKRLEMVHIMRAGMSQAQAAGVDLGSSEATARIMEQAPATIFFFNEGVTEETNIRRLVVETQSTGAAIQNMLLAAVELGLGTLWICDVFYAYDELRAWLGREDQMVAAVSVGWPAENPGPRPRLSWQEVTEWLD